VTDHLFSVVVNGSALVPANQSGSPYSTVQLVGTGNEAYPTLTLPFAGGGPSFGTLTAQVIERPDDLSGNNEQNLMLAAYSTDLTVLYEALTVHVTRLGSAE
jgi:hypothetical protein